MKLYYAPQLVKNCDYQGLVIKDRAETLKNVRNLYIVI